MAFARIPNMQIRPHIWKQCRPSDNVASMISKGKAVLA